MQLPTYDKNYWRPLRRYLKSLNRADRVEWLEGLNDAEIEAIPWWLVWYARDKQIPPVGDWSLWLILAGRGFGKTQTIAEFAHYKADSMPGSRGVIIAPTAGRDCASPVVNGQELCCRKDGGALSTGRRDSLDRDDGAVSVLSRIWRAQP